MKTNIQNLGKVSITCNGKWNNNKEYDRLCLVHDGFFASYISIQKVPKNILLTDTKYWQPVACLRDDIKLNITEFQKKVIELLSIIQIKLKAARLVVANIEERDSLTINEVAPGCEVYVLDTKQTWILDTIIQSDGENNNFKEWHLEIDSKIDSEEKYNIEGVFDNLTADRAICDAYGNIIHDTYITRETSKNYIFSVINDFLMNWKYEIPNDTITYDMLTNSLKQLFNNNGSVINNFADEEDLTVINNQLKLKDRKYVESSFNGMGYKILRKNLIGDLNLLEQSMINEPNTIYEVRYLFCLDGNTINFPENSIIIFNGGQFNNGIINLNKAKLINIFTDKDFGTAINNNDYAVGQQLWFVDEEVLKVFNGSEWKTINLI